MSDSDTNGADGENRQKERERSAVFTKLSPITILEELPNRVFPISMKVALPRTAKHNEPYDGYEPAKYPVSVSQPTETPYISDSTIHFSNPAERPPTGVKAWSQRTARDRLQKLVEDLAEEYPKINPDRFTTLGLSVVQVPARFLTTDDGETAVSQDLFDRNGNLTIAYFTKDSSLFANEVRDELGDALPGQGRAPLRLTRLDEVTAKQSRTGRGTAGRASRRRYFTEAEAERYDKLGATPAVYSVEDSPTGTRSARPLTPVTQNLSRFLPTLADSGLVESITFEGVTEERERFYAEEVLNR